MSHTPIPMVDLHHQYQTLKSEIQTALNDALDSTAFIMGPNVHAFEDEISNYLNIQHSISCASGTDALHLALSALGIGPGDEVITPSYTFAATAEAIRYVNATPVFVDIDQTTLNIDPNCIQNAITEKTRAIIAVHLFGLPADLDAIKAVIGERDIHLVEDCAQSFGAKYKNKMTGTIGDIGCFSFFPSKNLGCYGDGGLVCTASDTINEKLKLLRNHGSPKRYEHTIIGYNSRLDEIQAAILRIKLKYIDEYNQRRHDNANKYSAKLNELGISTPHENDDSNHVYHQYTLTSPIRDKFSMALSNENIASAIYYPKGLHQQIAFSKGIEQVSLPITELISSQCLSLPMYPELSDEQITRITDNISRQIQ